VTLRRREEPPPLSTSGVAADAGTSTALLAGAVLVLAGLATVLWQCFRRTEHKRQLVLEGSLLCAVNDQESDEEAGVGNAAAPTGAAQDALGAPQADELRSLLAAIEAQEPDLALPGVQSDGSQPDNEMRADAAQEVERVLAAPNAQAVLGGGSSAQRRAEFRRLVRLLHPDKGLVAGERANLALRRVVEACQAAARAA